jgi:hypothetical protein
VPDQRVASRSFWYMGDPGIIGSVRCPLLRYSLLLVRTHGSGIEKRLWRLTRTKSIASIAPVTPMTGHLRPCEALPTTAKDIASSFGVSLPIFG